MDLNTPPIEQGTRVSLAHPAGGDGVVFAVHNGESSRAYDVVFKSGLLALGVTLQEIGGDNWCVLDEKADPAEQLLLVDRAREVAREIDARNRLASPEFKAEVQRLVSAPEHQHLVAGDDMALGLLAARNMRATLRLAYPNCAFHVRKKGYGSVVVSWTDGPTEQQVMGYVAQHRSGYQDSSTKRFVETPTAFNSTFGGVENIVLRRDHSDLLIHTAYEKVFREFALDARGVAKPSAAAFRAGLLAGIPIDGHAQFSHLQGAVADCLQILEL